MEQQIVAWDKVSNGFDNKKFNGQKVSWNKLCFAGEDAKTDTRSGVSACHSERSYISPILIFNMAWKAGLQ